MPNSVAVLGKVVLLFASLCIPSSFSWAQGKSAVPDAGPDLELTEFRLSELEAMLRTMEAGPERDYFAGVLANRTGHIAESIGLLNSVLPTIRLSRSDRTAVALQALADDYNKTMTFSLGKLLSPGKVN